MEQFFFQIAKRGGIGWARICPRPPKLWCLRKHAGAAMALKQNGIRIDS
jgi:hypothetical protein